MYDDAGARKEVPHCYTDDNYKTLSVMLTPDVNNTSQMKRMHQISSKFGDRVGVGFIKGKHVLLALNSIVMRCLKWPLPESTLPKKSACS